MTENKKELTSSFMWSQELKDDLMDVLPEDKTLSEVLRERLKGYIARERTKNLEKEIERIKKEAKKDSYELLGNEYPVRERDNGEMEIMKESDFQRLIDDKKDEMKELDRKIDRLQSEKNTLIIDSAINENGIDKGKLRGIKNKIQEFEQDKEDVREIINQYKKQKAKARKAEQEREKLEARLTSNRIHDQIMGKVKSSLDERYTSFIDWWERWREVKRELEKHTKQAGESNFKANNFYETELKLNTDLAEIDVGGKNFKTDVDYRNKELSDVLPSPPPVDEPED